MMSCPKCGKKCKSKQGLGKHMSACTAEDTEVSDVDILRMQVQKLKKMVILLLEDF